MADALRPPRHPRVVCRRRLHRPRHAPAAARGGSSTSTSAGRRGTGRRSGACPGQCPDHEPRSGAGELAGARNRARRACRVRRRRSTRRLRCPRVFHGFIARCHPDGGRRRDDERDGSCQGGRIACGPGAAANARQSGSAGRPTCRRASGRLGSGGGPSRIAGPGRRYAGRRHGRTPRRERFGRNGRVAGNGGLHRRPREPKSSFPRRACAGPRDGPCRGREPRRGTIGDAGGLGSCRLGAGGRGGATRWSRARRSALGRRTGRGGHERHVPPGARVLRSGPRAFGRCDRGRGVAAGAPP
jgi:hypothetical protein